MIKINIIHPEEQIEEIDDMYAEPWEMCAEYTLSDEAAVPNALAMFKDALLLDGYHLKSIEKSMREYADFLKDEYDL